MPSSEGFSKEEVERITKWQFTGLGDAARLMQKRPATSKFVGRWDWHFWMFVVTTCLPCFGVYCFAMWVRSSLWKKHEKKALSEQPPDAQPDVTQSQDQLHALQEEIKRLKLMMLMREVDSPRLSPESLRRLYEQPIAEKRTPVHEEAKKDERQEASLSERVWGLVKPWLPFYVEPFHQRKDIGPVGSDITASAKTNRPTT